MKVLVRTVRVPPPSTSEQGVAHVTVPAAPWEQAEREVRITPARPASGPPSAPKAKGKGKPRK